MAVKRKVSLGVVEIEDIDVEEAQAIVTKAKQIEGLSPQTVRNYVKFFRHFRVFMAKNKKYHMRKLTEADAKNFIFYLLDREMQHNTINMYLTAAKGAFKVLAEEGVCEHIFKNVRYLREAEKSINVLTADEIGAIFKEMDLAKYTEFRDYVLMHVFLDGFSRIGETLALRIEDVDFESQTITFNKTKNKRIRTVPISSKTAKLLKRLIKEVEEFDSEYIFLSWHGKPLERSGHEVSVKMKEYAERAGVKKRVYPHLFRHSASANFIKESGNIRVLQKILGHSDISVTQKYAHVLDATVHDLHDKYSMVNQIEAAVKRKTKTTK